MPILVHPSGIESRKLIGGGWGAYSPRLAAAAGWSCDGCARYGVNAHGASKPSSACLAAAVGCALHGAIKRLGAIGRGRVSAAGLSCHCKDLIFGKPEIVTPALDVLACWPALPPAGNNACGIDAQR